MFPDAVYRPWSVAELLRGELLRAEAQDPDSIAAELEVLRMLRSIDGSETEHDAAMSVCESPIEQLFVATMFQFGWRLLGSMGATSIHGIEIVGRGNALLGHEVLGDAIVQPTVVLDGAETRPDLLFLAPNDRVLVVELDGHEFHERLPWQATRDKQRDRRSLLAGIATMRFTGSEVYANATRCVHEVNEFVQPPTSVEWVPF
jgi:hypothetical protein